MYLLIHKPTIEYRCFYKHEYKFLLIIIFFNFYFHPIYKTKSVRFPIFLNSFPIYKMPSFVMEFSLRKNFNLINHKLNFVFFFTLNSNSTTIYTDFIAIPWPDNLLPDLQFC